jgi:hypothetical protein
MEALLVLATLGVTWLVGLLIVIWVVPGLIVLLLAKTGDGSDHLGGR